MGEMDAVLLEEIGDSLFELPLNYRKIKCVFNSEYDSKTRKFIRVDKLETKKAIVIEFYKPISKLVHPFWMNTRENLFDKLER